MDLSLYKITSGGELDISNRSGNLVWSYQGETLGVNLTFDFVAYDIEVETGDIIRLKDNEDDETIIIGIVVSKSEKGNVYTYSVFDFGWYLNKSDVIIQFNNVIATSAIKQLLRKIGIECGQLPYMSTLINKIYIDAKPSDIIKEILEQVFLETGKQYFFEMSGSKLDIIEVGSEVLELEFKYADNLAPLKIDDVVGEDFTYTESIESMKNSVVVVSSDQDFYRILENKKDQDSINKYGLLQEVIKVDQKNESQSRNIANNALKELNRKMTSTSIPLRGHKKIKQYRKLKINLPGTKLIGTFLILSANHTYSDGDYMTSIMLEVV